MKGWGSIVRYWFRAGLLAAALVTLLGGCAPSFTFGIPPKTDQLHQLRRGASTSFDIRRILGEPRGKGGTRLPMGYRTLWFYDSGQFDGGSQRQRFRFLIIFLDGETYDGYLWFDIDTKFEKRHAS